MSFSEIPVVDLSPWTTPDADRSAFAAEVIEICHHIGFFVVVNHGIEPAFLDRVFAMMRDLFALDEDEKRRIDKQRSPHFRGWEQLGSEYTNGRPDMREQVDLWTEHPARTGVVEPLHLRLLGPNQWLPDEVLPGFRALSLEWFERCGVLADQLLGVMSVGLGLDEDHLRGLFGQETMSLTKFIHYPPTPTGAAGVNPHHDAGFLTVLAAGETPGLEVKSPEGKWIAVPNIPGGLVINLGEMLQGISGNYLVATAHRVVTMSERLSAGYFHGPSLDTSLAPPDLAPFYREAVAMSPRHANAGFMARRSEVESGVEDMGSSHRAEVYGEQLWNYFCRSYPDMVARHYPATAT